MDGVVLVSFVASHRNRELAVLDRLTVGAAGLADAVVRTPSIDGVVVLPTCNRFEVYLEADDAVGARAVVVEQLALSTHLERDVIADALVTYEGDDAVQHLISVASGLDSMVVGEREISGQVRRAHADAQSAHHISPRLDRLFQSALRTSRVVASSTGLGTSGHSVVSVALDLADSTAQWRDARVLIIGTGALAEAGLGGLIGRGARLRGVFSPSGRATEFAAAHGLTAVDSADLASAVRDADVIYACSGGESIVLTPALVARARAGVDHSLTIIDLALHRDVAAGVSDLRGVNVISLEDVGARAPSESVGAVEAARSIVAHAVARFGDGETSRDLDPAVVALREHVFGLLEREIARIRPTPGADADAIASADATEAALRRFAKTLLHTPTVRAREHAAAGDSERYLAAIRALYGIDVAVPPDACPAIEPSHPTASA